MSEPSVNADESLLENSTALVESLEETMKYAKQLETDKSELVAQKEALAREVETLKSSHTPPATLHKVASVSEDVLSETLNFLVERELLDSGDIEKLASTIRENPDTALRLVEQVANITAQPVTSDGGRGIPKSAGVRAQETNDSGFGPSSDWL